MAVTLASAGSEPIKIKTYKPKYKSLKSKNLLIIIFLLLFGKTVKAQNKIDEIFKLKIERAMISRGDNFPDFKIKKDSLDKFLCIAFVIFPEIGFAYLKSNSPSFASAIKTVGLY